MRKKSAASAPVPAGPSREGSPIFRDTSLAYRLLMRLVNCQRDGQHDINLAALAEQEVRPSDLLDGMDTKFTAANRALRNLVSEARLKAETVNAGFFRFEIDAEMCQTLDPQASGYHEYRTREKMKTATPTEPSWTPSSAALAAPAIGHLAAPDTATKQVKPPGTPVWRAEKAVSADQEAWIKARLRTAFAIAVDVGRHGKDCQYVLVGALDGLINSTAIEVLEVLDLEPAYVNLGRISNWL